MSGVGNCQFFNNYALLFMPALQRENQFHCLMPRMKEYPYLKGMTG
jgi:hypothetical protein